jgi:hypothetical protein
MKRLLILAVLVVGCGSPPPGQTVDQNGGTGTFTQSNVTLKDGRTVPCLFWTYDLNSTAGWAAMSCDWSAAK